MVGNPRSRLQVMVGSARFIAFCLFHTGADCLRTTLGSPLAKACGSGTAVVAHLMGDLLFVPSSFVLSHSVFSSEGIFAETSLLSYPCNVEGSGWAYLSRLREAMQRLRDEYGSLDQRAPFGGLGSLCQPFARCLMRRRSVRSRSEQPHRLLRVVVFHVARS
jgi:hypothetical protein